MVVFYFLTDSVSVYNNLKSHLFIISIKLASLLDLFSYCIHEGTGRKLKICSPRSRVKRFSSCNFWKTIQLCPLINEKIYEKFQCTISSSPGAVGHTLDSQLQSVCIAIFQMHLPFEDWE